MDRRQDLVVVAKTIIDSNLYMTLGTADEAGRPWVSPVYYATAEYGEFFWVSSPEATHSLNLAARPQLAIVIFDSRAPVGTGEAVQHPRPSPARPPPVPCHSIGTLGARWRRIERTPVRVCASPSAGVG